MTSSSYLQQHLRRVSMLALICPFAILTACTSESVPETAKTLTTRALEVVKDESLGNLAVSYADWYADQILSVKNNDPKDSTDTSNQPSRLTIVIDGVTVSMEKKYRNQFPKMVTLDFGTTSGVDLGRGNVVKGRGEVILGDESTTADSWRTYTFRNFQINNRVINGIHSVTFRGFDANQAPYWEIRSTDTIHHDDGTFLTLQTEKKQTGLNGASSHLFSTNLNTSFPGSATQNPELWEQLPMLMYWHSTYFVSGSIHGQNSGKETYRLYMIENHPLRMGEGFPFYTQGKMLLQAGQDRLVLDFGKGAKDNRLTSTLHGLSRDFFWTE